MSEVENRINPRAEYMRELILDASLKIFENEGLEKLSIRRIVKEIDYSIRTIYIYYKNKNEILEALHTMGFKKLILQQKQSEQVKDPLLRLIKHIKIILNFAMQYPGYYRLMFNTKEVDQIIKEKNDWKEGRLSYGLLKKDVKLAMDSGKIVKSDIDAVSFSYWSYIHGMCTTLLNERHAIMDASKYKKIVEESINFLFYKLNKR